MTAGRRTQDRAEALAAVLPPLLVAANRVAATVLAGVHGRRRVGQGETFWQFRRYQAGDPVAAVDWRQSAKSDPLYVREYEWEAAQSVWLWCDRSPSMAYRSARELPTKGERASLLTVALASLLVRGGERIALLDGGPAWARPGTGRTALIRLAAALDRPAEGPGGMPRPAPLPRFAEVVLVGDFLAPLHTVDESVRHLASGGVRGHLLQISDPAEETLPFQGRVRFVGPEGEGDVLIARTEAVRADYRRRVADHREGLAAIARAARWTFAVHHTDAAPGTALLALYAALAPAAGGWEVRRC